MIKRVCGKVLMDGNQGLPYSRSLAAGIAANASGLQGTNLNQQSANATAPQSPVPSFVYYPQQYGNFGSNEQQQQQNQLLNAMQQFKSQQPTTQDGGFMSALNPASLLPPPTLTGQILGLSKKADVTSGTIQGTKSEAENKRQKRLELNRRSAQLSRQRKKERLSELERTVSKLTEENRELRKKNEELNQMIKQQESNENTKGNKKRNRNILEGDSRSQGSDKNEIKSALTSLIEENNILKQKLQASEQERLSTTTIGKIVELLPAVKDKPSKKIKGK